MHRLITRLSMLTTLAIAVTGCGDLDDECSGLEVTVVHDDARCTSAEPVNVGCGWVPSGEAENSTCVYNPDEDIYFMFNGALNEAPAPWVSCDHPQLRHREEPLTVCASSD